MPILLGMRLADPPILREPFSERTSPMADADPVALLDGVPLTADEDTYVGTTLAVEPRTHYLIVSSSGLNLGT